MNKHVIRQEIKNHSGSDDSPKSTEGVLNSGLSNAKGSSNIKELFRPGKFMIPLLSILIGGVAGFVWYYFVGCKSGTCPITGSPFGSIISGGLLGFLLFGSFDSGHKSSENKKIK